MHFHALTRFRSYTRGIRGNVFVARQKATPRPINLPLLRESGESIGRRVSLLAARQARFFTSVCACVRVQGETLHDPTCARRLHWKTPNVVRRMKERTRTRARVYACALKTTCVAACTRRGHRSSATQRHYKWDDKMRSSSRMIRPAKTKIAAIEYLFINRTIEFRSRKRTAHAREQRVRCAENR